VLRRRPQKFGGRRRAEREREQSQAGARAEDQPPIPLALLPAFCAAGQASLKPKRVLRPAGPENLVAADELRGEREREQIQAGAKAED
jgi:hypothetical protein